MGRIPLGVRFEPELYAAWLPAEADLKRCRLEARSVKRRKALMAKTAAKQEALAEAFQKGSVNAGDEKGAGGKKKKAISKTGAKKNKM